MMCGGAEVYIRQRGRVATTRGRGEGDSREQERGEDGGEAVGGCPASRGSREQEERVGWCRIDRSRAEKGGVGKRRGAEGRQPLSHPQISA